MALYSWLVQSRLVDYALSGATVGFVAIVAGVYLLQNRLIYLPQFPPGSRKEVWRPSRFGFAKYEEVTLFSLDGVKLHAFWIPDPNSRQVPTVLLFHANAGNMGHRLPIMKRIADLVPVNFFVISYRGYGLSEGFPNEVGIRKDAQAALDYLLRERKDELDLGRLIVYGQSIGGAVGIDLTARNQSRIAGLIVENTFRSLRSLVPHVMPLLRWAAPLCHQRWESETRILEMVSTGDLVPKMLFLSGGKDEMIPSHHMKHLHSLVDRPELKEKISLHIFPEGTHNDTCLQPGYFEAIAEFIKSI